MKKLIERLKKIKHIEIIIAIIIALILLSIYFLIEFYPKETKKEENPDDLATSIEEILSKIDGVGDCYVYLTYQKKDVLYENKSKENTSSDNNYKESTKETTSSPVILEDKIMYDENEKIYGVVVVCEGGDDIKVKLKIVDAIKVLLDVDGINIQVYKS